MLSTLRSDTGQIQGVCEWHLVNQDGQQDIHGIWIWVQQLECSEGQSTANVVRYCIQDIVRRCPQAVWAYWQRQDRTGTQLKTYTKWKLLTYSLKEVMV